MSLQDDLSTDPHGAVFDVPGAVRAGMPGWRGGGDGFQPMRHSADPQTGLIWFISSTGTALVQALGMGEATGYVVIPHSHEADVSLRGTLYPLHTGAKLEELWNPVVAALFEGGHDDPQLALLLFDPEAGEIRASSGSTPKFGFAITRANPDPPHRPDIGAKATVTFPRAA